LDSWRSLSVRNRIPAAIADAIASVGVC